LGDAAFEQAYQEEDRDDDDLNFDIEDDEDPLTYTKTAIMEGGPPLNNPFK
jgi:hypothetical protein